jgi:hypothetical protein
MNDQRKLLVGVFVILLLAAGVVWFAGTPPPDAPDCSTVSYDGDGTEANPYEVSNVEQLQCINEQGLDANYVQVSDIDTSETSSWNSNRGFDPISTFNRGFNGTFDGQRYNITDLMTYRREAGLFHRVSEGGKVTNVSLVNAEIITSAGGERSIAGTLVALNMGTVSDSHATGTVNKRGVGGSPNRQGGLVGHNFGTIERSHTSVSVDGDDTRMGGLVGLNSGIINNSYAAGPVNGSNGAGGLVGINRGAIDNSYATGSVSGSVDVGGLVGRNVGGTVTESYATGLTEGVGRLGGLVGTKEKGGTANESYWDIETTGQSTSAGGTGLNTSEMTGSAARGNMTGFDFTSTWETVRGDYPVLSWQAERDTHD